MARQDRVAQLMQMLDDAITNNDMDKASEIRSDLYREFQLKMSHGGRVHSPRLGTSVKEVGEVFDAIDDPSYVRDTTRIDNLKRGIERGSDSTVTRSMGYNKIFETFQKNRISKATIQKFKEIPRIENFKNANDYSKALKKFRETAFKGLDTKQINVIKSSGFLSQYAKEQRLKMLKSGIKFSQANLNKTIDTLYDFTFMTPESAVGVKKPKIQSKVYTEIRDMAKKTLNAAQRLNLDFALSQVDKLFKAGNTKKAQAMLAGIGTLVSKGAFGAVLKTVGGPPGMAAGLALDAPMIINAAKQVKEEAIDPLIIEPAAKKMVQGENILKQMFMPNMNEGGIMDMDYMMRPIGYAEGGFEDRMAMLEDSAMNRDNFGKVQDDAVIRAALQIASNQGDTSEDNINLIIDQLYQLVPSVEQTMEQRTKPDVPTKLMEGIGNLMNRLTGNFSKDRNVGFSRVE